MHRPKVTQATGQPVSLSPPSGRPGRIRRRVLAVISISLLVLASISITWMIVIRQQRIPELTRENFDAARVKWDATNIDDYAIETIVVGMQPATYRAEVRNGEILAAQRNGYALKDQRTLGTWSVPGMFRTIEHDLLNFERDEAEGKSTRELHLRAEFDPELGIPRRYLRVEWSSGAQVSWDVAEFTQGQVAAEPVEVSDNGK